MSNSKNFWWLIIHVHIKVLSSGNTILHWPKQLVLYIVIAINSIRSFVNLKVKISKNTARLTITPKRSSRIFHCKSSKPPETVFRCSCWNHYWQNLMIWNLVNFSYKLGEQTYLKILWKISISILSWTLHGPMWKVPEKQELTNEECWPHGTCERDMRMKVNYNVSQSPKSLQSRYI